jgi:D-apiose dehydrogenase
MLRIAIAGLGAAARSIHVPACRSIAGLELVGGYDPASSARTLGVPAYASLEELFDKAKPDVLIVATPPATHFQVASWALEAGAHVLCEKPFASNLEEAVALVRLARQKHRLLAVNNEYRFMRCHRAARAQIGSPGFGELLFARVEQTFDSSGITTNSWRDQDPEHTCKEFGTHALDLCRYFFAAEPLRLRATMPRPISGDPVDRLNLVEVEFPGQRFAHVTLDRLSRGRHRYLDIRLDGTRAAIECEIGGRLSITAGVNARTRRPYVDVDVSRSARSVIYAGEHRKLLARDPGNLFPTATAALLRGLLAAIESGAEPECSGADNLRSFGMMRAAYDSAASGSVIDLGYLQSLAQD